MLRLGVMKTAKRNKTVVVGMSGGVDSSVAAALLKKEGFDVVGVFMKNWSQDFGDFGCTWAEDAEDARKVASKLGIPFYVWNFEKEYYDKVVEYFLKEYSSGRTPNPDAMCNKEIKFRVFLEKALSLGADFVATGHYARCEFRKGYHRLLRGKDPNKDQSYFLYTLKQEQLKRILFPIGYHLKPDIRKIAQRLALPTYAKKDSQGICFIGKINVTEFLRAHIKAESGLVVTKRGEVVGKHYGLPFYTIGQREGLGIGGGGGPYYVVGKKQAVNQLLVTADSTDPMLWRNKFIVNDLTWTGKVPKLPLSTGVAIRYRHPAVPALLQKLKPDSIMITFDQPQRAITPGQAAVFYADDECLGGGLIKKVL